MQRLLPPTDYDAIVAYDPFEAPDSCPAALCLDGTLTTTGDTTVNCNPLVLATKRPSSVTAFQWDVNPNCR